MKPDLCVGLLVSTLITRLSPSSINDSASCVWHWHFFSLGMSTLYTLSWYNIMHAWKKIALTESLEQSLPGHLVDCVLINGWTATVFVRQPEHGAIFCTTGIDLAKLADGSSVHKLAEELVCEVYASRRELIG